MCFATDDSPPLAAVSVGDLDSADVATWAVPGMGSSAAGLPAWANTAMKLVQAQGLVDEDHTHAVVAWVGYKAPAVGALSVLDTNLASAGAATLSQALVGFNATRESAMLNVASHSYGTTTSALALVRPEVQVDVFVSLASAGLPAEVDHASDLNANQVYAGQAQDVWAVDPAPGDQWAWVGRGFSTHPVNPAAEAFGADVFGVDTGAGGASVTDHGTSTESGTGYLDPDTESQINVAYATTGQGDRITNSVDHEPTPFQRALIEGMRGAY
ncbi:alpha/beta hydrolase [Microbacterium sp. zg.Y909]|uniref:alpha/beta hydrolase n=1 Tax=Microbacterium sp. zg.Y909 TaxID=2969413 RepID=UPI0027D7E2F2|nr:alpha/beta hydrolase [Microbacterium sp. zg.Y909]